MFSVLVSWVDEVVVPVDSADVGSGRELCLWCRGRNCGRSHISASTGSRRFHSRLS